MAGDDFYFATSTTTPAITLTLGDITPSSVSTANITLSGTISVSASIGTIGQILTSNGVSPASWQSPAAVTSSFGASTQIAYNNAGTETGSNGLTWVDSTTTLGVGKINTIGGITALTTAAQFTIQGPSNGGTPGAIALLGGTGSSAGGNVLVIGGLGTSAGAGGSVSVSGGAAVSSGAGFGGNLYVQGGVGGSTGSGGAVAIQTTTSTSVVDRLRILANGAWSVGSTGANTGTAGQVITSNGSSAPPTWQAVIAKPAPLVTVVVSTVTNNFGSAADHNVHNRISAGTDATFTIQPDSFWTGTQQYYDNNFNPITPGPMPIGGNAIFGKTGIGNIIFVAGAGVTINSPASLSITTLNGKATLIKVGVNQWDLEGNIAP